MGRTTRIWLTIVWIGIGVEGLWFFVAFSMVGIIDPKHLTESLRLILIFAIWLGLVFAASFFRRAPSLLPWAALANLIGCVALKGIPRGGTPSDYSYLAYTHLIDVVILASSYFSFQQRQHETKQVLASR